MRPPGPGMGGDHGRRAGGGGLIMALLNPCGTSCREAAEACREAAQDKGVECGHTTCATEIAAAQAACTAAKEATTCRSAVTALATCLTPCLDALGTANEACHTTAQSCHTACQATTTP